MPLQQIFAHCYDWRYGSRTKNSPLTIGGWGFTPQSEPVYLRFENFKPFTQFQLPSSVGGRFKTWSKSDMHEVYTAIQTTLEKRDVITTGYEFHIKPMLQGCELTTEVDANGQTTIHSVGKPIIKLFFENLSMLDRAVSTLCSMYGFYAGRHGKINLTVHEQKVNPVRKMITEQNFKYASWFQVTGELVTLEEDKLSTNKLEYIVDYNTISEVPFEQCATWVSRPLIMAMDIEVYSKNHRAMPNKLNPADVAYMISCVVQRYKDRGSRRYYGLIIGDCNVPSDKLQNCEIRRFDTELELIHGYAALVNEVDADVITGYNLLSFDYPYLDHRLTRLREFWPCFGRLKNVPCTIKRSAWRSGAYGFNVINEIDMQGRLTVDAYPVIRRDKKFDDYRLNTVCREILGAESGKYDMTPQQMFEIYQEKVDMTLGMQHLAALVAEQPQVIDMPNYNEYYQQLSARYEASIAQTTKVMEYCIQDSALVIDLFEKCDMWTSLTEMSSIVGVTVTEVFTRGQQIRCVSQIYDRVTKEGMVMDKSVSRGNKYTGGSVSDPVVGVTDKVLVLDFKSLYPSIIIAFNMCYSTFVTDPDIPDEWCNVVDFDQEEKIVRINGKIVDSKGNATRAGDADDEDKADDLFDKDELEAEKDSFREIGKQKKTVEKKTVHYRFRFLKREIRFGILPQLCNQLICDRDATRAQQGKTTNEDTKDILEMRQLAIKVAANSIYGFLGVQEGGMLPMVEVAMSVTAKGREMIGVVRQLVLANGGEIIYGDTDSVMVTLNVKERKDCNKVGKALSQLISGVKKTVRNAEGKKIGGDLDSEGRDILEDRPGIFGSEYIIMNSEGAKRIFCIKKKKYAALLIMDDGSFKKVDIKKDGKIIGQGKEYEVYKRGIVLVRRDNIPFLRFIYGKILYDILTKGCTLENYVNNMKFLVEQVQLMMANKIEYTKFISTRSLGANYKSASYFMKIFSDRLLAAKKLVSAGDRLDFLVVKVPEAKLLGEKMFLVEQCIDKSSGTPVLTKEIDYRYYLEKVLCNPITQLISIGFNTIVDKLKDHVGIKPARCKMIGVDKPIKMMLRMMDCVPPVPFTGIVSTIKYQAAKQGVVDEVQAEPVAAADLDDTAVVEEEIEYEVVVEEEIEYDIIEVKSPQSPLSSSSSSSTLGSPTGMIMPAAARRPVRGLNSSSNGLLGVTHTGLHVM